MHRAGDWLKRSIGGEAQDLLNVVSVLNVIKDSDCVQQTRPVVCQAAERVLNPKHKHQTYNGEERMSVSHPVHRFHRTVASVSIVALLSSSLLAQTGQTSAATPQQSARTGRVCGPSETVHAAEFDFDWMEAVCAARVATTGAEKQRSAAQPDQRRQADAVIERRGGAGAGKQF